MAHHYIAQFLPQEDGTFCVFFPDLVLFLPNMIYGTSM